MAKEVKEGKKRRIGDLINELSRKPTPFEIKVGGNVYPCFIYPASQELLIEYSTEAVKAGEDGKAKEAMKKLICGCLKDEDGDAVWEKPEDIDVSGSLFSSIERAMYQHALMLNLSEFAIKNSEGSRS